MKTTWETPRILVQEFEANEYVAACWGVACDTDAANQYEQKIGAYIPGHLDHGKDHCGFSGNQVIYDDDGDGTADRMIEVGTDGLGRLNCTIYTDGDYNTTRPVSSVKANQTIYWTTSAGEKVWHHVGHVYETVPGHPNRS